MQLSIFLLFNLKKTLLNIELYSGTPREVTWKSLTLFRFASNH